jgi:hypothetical protein
MGMNRAVVIIHGAGGFDLERGSGALASHLGRALAAKYDVRCPQLPAPENRRACARLLDGQGHWFHAGLPELIADVEGLSGIR